MAIFYKPEGLAGPMASKKSGSGKRFQFPKFEREAFLEKEVRDAKVSFISLGIATLMVIVSLLLSSVHVGLALIIGFLGPFSLYVILPAVGIDTSEFERKNWMGPGMITFFAWLGLFILLSNPPFQDLADPKIDYFKVYQQEPSSGNWTRLEADPDSGGYSVTNGTFVIVLRIMDNWELERYDMTLEGAATGIKSPELQVLGQANNYSVPMRERDEGHIFYVHFIELEAGSYTVKVSAEDSKENSVSRQWTLVVN